MAKLAKVNDVYVIDNPNLSVINEMELDNGEMLEVNVSLVDKRYISDQQRKFIFALCGIVEMETGMDSEFFRARIMSSFDGTYQTNKESLTAYSMTDAKNLIDLILIYMIDNRIVVDTELLKSNNVNFNYSHTYLMCFQRICVICGKRADLHHVDVVGMSRDRNKINHVGKRMLPLCRIHHNAIHEMGDDRFIEYHNLTPIKIDKKLEHFIKTGKIKVFKENDERCN